MSYIQCSLCFGKLAEHLLPKRLSLGAPDTDSRSKAAQGARLPTCSANLTQLLKSSSPSTGTVLVFVGAVVRCAASAAAACPAQPIPLASGQGPCQLPSPTCQGEGKGLHSLPDLSMWFMFNTSSGRVLKIPWMHLNRNRLGSTYVCCHILHFWERCKCS